MVIRLPLVIAAIALGACSVGGKTENRDPGPETNRSYQVGAFDRLSVAGPYDVRVVSGGQPGITATGGQALLDETEVVVEGGELKIRPKKRDGIRFNWTRGKAVFTVNAAALKAAEIAGSGDIIIDKVSGDFDGGIAGSGGLNLASVQGGKLKLGIAGSGSATAAGKADSVELEIAGSGDIDAANVAAGTASVSIAGSGGVKANASQSADVTIMGSGDVEVKGGAKCNVTKHGSGNVRCS